MTYPIINNAVWRDVVPTIDATAYINSYTHHLWLQPICDRTAYLKQQLDQGIDKIQHVMDIASLRSKPAVDGQVCLYYDISGSKYATIYIYKSGAEADSEYLGMYNTVRSTYDTSYHWKNLHPVGPLGYGYVSSSGYIQNPISGSDLIRSEASASTITMTTPTETMLIDATMTTGAIITSRPIMVTSIIDVINNGSNSGHARFDLLSTYKASTGVAYGPEARTVIVKPIAVSAYRQQIQVSHLIPAVSGLAASDYTEHVVYAYGMTSGTTDLSITHVMSRAQIIGVP